jgi:tight adherence protein B
LFKDVEDVRVKLEADDQVDSTLVQQLQSMVEQSGLDLTVNRLLSIAAGLALGMGAAVGLLRQNVFVGVVIGLVSGCGPLLYVRMKQKARRRKILEQLPDAFDLMARVIRAGQTMSQALQAVADEFDPPISGEFTYCYEQQNMGLAPEIALRDLARRTGLLEIRIFVLAMMVQQQTGGNLAELLEKLAAIVRERFRMRGKIRALTAEGRLQAIILLGLVPLIFLIILVLNRSYAQVLLDRPGLLVATATLEAAGALWIRKIVNFDF